MIDKSPIRYIALNLFQDSFGDLVSIRAEMTHFERSLIEATYELIWLDMFDGSARQSWAQTLRAAFKMLDNGALREPQLLWESYIKIVNQIVPALHKSFDKRRDVKHNQIGEDALVEGCLSTYKSIYEGLLPLVLAPVVHAFGIVNDPKEKVFVPRQDGRISLAAIRKMERWLRPPQNRLAIGLNNHIRNAYSHDYYQILDHGRVKMHDVDPRSGKTVWGPEILTSEDLSQLCDQVWLNSLAIVSALALYGMNYRKVAIARNWGIPVTPPSLRDRDFKRTLEVLADEASFDVKQVCRSDLECQLKLATRMKGLDQDEEVFMGGDSWARRFNITVKYIEIRIVEQAVRFLQNMTPFLDDIRTVHVCLSTSSGQQLGEIKTSRDVIKNLAGPSTQDIGEVRKSFEIDTLGETTMHVRVGQSPTEV